MELRGKLFIALCYRSVWIGLKFPAQAQVNGDAKVPFLLYYDKTGCVSAAGAEVFTESVDVAALTEGWSKAEWLVISYSCRGIRKIHDESRWKLHLPPKHLISSINADDNLPPLPPGKSAIDILADFIKYLFQCAKTYIQEHHLEFSWSSVEHRNEYIFTHPNGWESVQQIYLQAIEIAGIIPSTGEGRPRVHILTEGEASLRFCIGELINSEVADLEAPRGVVVMDAGGATIDLSMFSISSNLISCEEIVPAECMHLLLMTKLLLIQSSVLGRPQGAVFVTRRARLLLERWLLTSITPLVDESTEI